MKIGLLTAILGEYDFAQTAEFASKTGFEGLEVACWPSGKAGRRYAGVSHIDVDDTSEENVQRIKEICRKNRIEISALSYYPNIMDADREKAKACEEHLYKVIHAAQKLNVQVVGTFIGRDQTRSISWNMERFTDIWKPIIREAEKCGVKIAIENCPMLFTEDEWPGGQNLATTPKILRDMFERIPSDSFGLNFDPSHFVWQQMDYVKAVYEFRDKLFHVHFKDIAVDVEKFSQVGVMGLPLEYMEPRIPGHGDVKWKNFIEALYDVGYDGYAAVEIEDKEYEDNLDRIKESITLSYNYLHGFMG